MTVSNVDNLGARVDPVVVGAHLVAGRPLTCEVARKEGDMGGAPVAGRRQAAARRGPALSSVASTRSSFPSSTRIRRSFDLDALDGDYDLSWLYVLKDVDGRRAVQLERLYHEVSAFVPAQYLEVPRAGSRGRFLPIKTPADLERAQDDLRELVSAPI